MGEGTITGLNTEQLRGGIKVFVKNEEQHGTSAGTQLTDGFIIKAGNVKPN